MLETIGEAFLAVANARHQAAVVALGNAVRPVYRADDRGRPDHEGSCILLHLRNTKYVLTASHVIEAGANCDSNLYIGGERKFVKMSGICYRSPAPDGVLKDRFDFALMPLSDDDISSLGAVNYITEATLSKAQARSKGHVYSVIGYPNTKNRGIDEQRSAAPSNRWSYFSVSRDGTEVSRKIKVDGDQHIFIGYDKYSLDAAGKRVTAVRTKGVSGGAVIDLGRLSDPEALDPEASFTPRLAGLFVEYHKDKRIMVATRIGFILDSLERAGAL
ncbi:hypothetical protein BCO9919_02726 [Burkholderia cenocepacia]|uniref:Serine protease n=1 Tax=Burkholderia cenocepacia TaxID=95486 RepID=A0A6J5J6R3_9BURK|nr:MULTISPECIES: hypothetical protein [Burkholderia cepacia complex]CAB3967382.1 hypothetical protein BCO9919_02726 [Burkholderia cenocepacia]